MPTPVISALANKPLSVYERTIPFLVLFFLLGFVIISCASFYATKAKLGAAVPWIDPIPIIFLALLTTSFGIWFILAFTGPPTVLAKQRECFRFAYSFTIATFIILAFPFLDLWKPDITGPIGLVRGCVIAGDGRTVAVDSPIACPGSGTTPGTSDTARKQVAGAPPTATEPPAAATESASYPWLLTIGGFVGQTRCEPTKDDKCEGQTAPGRHSVITSGLVIPFYVVFIAFIGGAVSLSRRIPEYQKRADADYAPLAGEAPALKPYEARETVVFQIMQLVSAPFIAITAYWAIAPTTVSSSIGLAFVSGFASETILLLIRGVVDGVRPQSTVAKPPAPGTPGTGAAVPTEGATGVMTKVALKPETPADAGTLKLTADDVDVPVSAEGFAEVHLQAGQSHLLVATARSGGADLRGELTLTPTVDDEGQGVSIDLTKSTS